MSHRARLRAHRNRDWWDHAACVGRTDVDWFPCPTGDPGPALAVCRGCPVILACRAEADAMEQPMDPDGVWGGESEAMRITRRRRTR